MTDNFRALVDYVMSDEDSELAKTKAELSYALFSLEREISINQELQAQNGRLYSEIEKLHARLNVVTQERDQYRYR